ncbi:hypothetical protein BC940DRAFT_335041 [Gongronella butleri]|nr:hypothetical protein BC940DRAFT_335041 [Gongronella butleri]
MHYPFAISKNPLLCDALDTVAPSSSACTSPVLRPMSPSTSIPGSNGAKSIASGSRPPSLSLSKRPASEHVSFDAPPTTPRPRSQRWSNLTFSTLSSAEDDGPRSPMTPRSSLLPPFMPPMPVSPGDNTMAALQEQASVLGLKMGHITRAMQAFHPSHHATGTIKAHDRRSLDETPKNHDKQTDHDHDDLDHDKDAPWRARYMGLVLQMARHGDQLESFALQMSHAQRRLVHYHTMANALFQQYDQQEKYYETLLRSLTTTITTTTTVIAPPNSFSASSTPDTSSPLISCPPTPVPQHRPRLSSASNSPRQSANMAETHELVHKARWYTGMMLGTDVGTGQVIHVDHASLKDVCVIAAGFGILADNAMDQARWIADQDVVQCQCEADGKPCSALFTVVQRKHHCRRCGRVVCQRHSGNRLPLFESANPLAKWCRVCDQCFLHLLRLFCR